MDEMVRLTSGSDPEIEMYFHILQCWQQKLEKLTFLQPMLVKNVAQVLVVCAKAR